MLDQSPAHFRPEQLDPLLIQAVSQTGAHIGSIYLLDPEQHVLRLAAATGMSERMAAPWKQLGLTAPVPSVDAMREQRLVWVGAGEMGRYYPRIALSTPYDFALAAAPIITGTTSWGALNLLWPGAHYAELSQSKIDTINSTCDRVGALMQQIASSGGSVQPGREPRLISLPRTRRTGQDEAQAAVDYAERIPEGSCSLDLDGKTTFVSSVAAALVGASIPDLLGVEPWKALPWLDNLVCEERHRAALISYYPTSCTAVRPPRQGLQFQFYPDVSGVSLRITPTDVTSVTGVADVTGTGAAKAAEETRSTRATDFSRVAAYGPGTPYPPPAALTQTGALYHLMHLAATLTEAVSAQDVVTMVADEIMPAFNAHGFVMYVAEGGRLRIIGCRGYSDSAMDYLDGASLKNAPTPAAYSLTRGETSFFSSPKEMARLYPRIPEITEKAAWAYLPLIASGRPVGCCVLSYDFPHTFTADDRSFLASLAGLIAQALDRARAYDAKHRLAQDLQAGLLPRSLPTVPGLEVAARYLPVTHGMGIGGDFYDLIRLSNTTVAATIGDVQGHSVPAAALMGQVRTAVHATAGAPPGEVLARTNRLLIDLDTGLFTSCLYIDLDLAHHRACLATAGHPPPLLRHPDGPIEVVHIPPGLLLGIDPAVDYPAIEIPLPPGAVLAMYTDGLLENGDLGKLDRLSNQLAGNQRQSMDALADSIISEDQRAGSRYDDIALLLLHPQPVSSAP